MSRPLLGASQVLWLPAQQKAVFLKWLIKAHIPTEDPSAGPHAPEPATTKGQPTSAQTS